MANKNPQNKFKPGNKAAKGKLGKQHRSTLKKKLLQDAEALSLEFPQLGDFRKLWLLNMYEGFTDSNKHFRNNFSLKAGDFFEPKKKIVDAGEGIQKALEVYRPLEQLINPGTMPIPFVNVNVNTDPEQKMEAERKRIQEAAKKYRELKNKTQKKKL